MRGLPCCVPAMKAASAVELVAVITQVEAQVECNMLADEEL